MHPVHQKQWTFLTNAARAETLAHAYIFSGNDGSEQARIALEFAAFIHCPRKTEEAGACGCASCVSVRAGGHADTLRVAPHEEEGEEARGITIAQIRELKRAMSLGSWYSGFKVVLIEQAHLMGQEAQSSCLKLLEEPSGKAVFILLTNHAKLLLETIRSRSQEVRWYAFGTLSEDQKRCSPQAIARARELCSVPLYGRLQLAKQVADSKTCADDLTELMKGTRLLLRDEIQNNSPSSLAPSPFARKLAKLARLLLAGNAMLRTTTANPRLIVEDMFLRIE